LLVLLLIFSYFKSASASDDGTADGVAFDELSQDTGKEDKSDQGTWCPNFLQPHGELSHPIKTAISVLATIVSIFLIISIIILLQRSDTDSWWIIFLVVLAAVCTCVCCCVLAILSDQLDFFLNKKDATGGTSGSDGVADADGAADGVSFEMGMGESPNPLISAKEGPASKPNKDPDAVICDIKPASTNESKGEFAVPAEPSAAVAAEEPPAAEEQSATVAAAPTEQPAPPPTQQPVSDDDSCDGQCVELNEWTAQFGDSEESIAAFHEYDKDGDGKISSAELEEFNESEKGKTMYGSR